MKSALFLAGGIVAAAILTGCASDSSQDTAGGSVEQQRWEKQIKESYPEWKPSQDTAKAAPAQTAPATVQQEPALPLPSDPAPTAVLVQNEPAAQEEKPFFTEPANFKVENNYGTYKTAPEPVTVKVPDIKEPVKHIVKKGENLSKISKHYYGVEHRWTEIYEANKSKISKPDLIQPGLELTIPSK